MLTDDDIKQVFFYCDNWDPNGFYADGVDVIEFGKKIAAFAVSQAVKAERDKCVEFVMSLNSEVGRALAEKRG